MRAAALAMSTTVGPERARATIGAVAIAAVAVLTATVARRRENEAAASSAPGIAKRPTGAPAGRRIVATMTSSGIQ